ncbi:hypothetical protein [Moorena producens]
MINIYIFYCQRSAVSGQWSAVSRQPSAYFIQKLFGVAWPTANG